MATCPKCGKFLDDTHRCTPSWHSHVRMIGSLGRSAAIGVVIGGLVFMIIDGHASWPAVAVSGLIGIVLDLALHLR